MQQSGGKREMGGASISNGGPGTTAPPPLATALLSSFYFASHLTLAVKLHAQCMFDIAIVVVMHASLENTQNSNTRLTAFSNIS